MRPLARSKPEYRLVCTFRLDRLRFTSCGCPATDWVRLADFRAERRHWFLRKKGGELPYRQVHRAKNPVTGTTVVQEYDETWPWLDPLRVTVIPDDCSGVQRDELESIVRAFGDHHLHTVECAFDFRFGSGVDYEFVRRFGRFGKLRLHDDSVPKGSQRLVYGRRQGSRVVRCYPKAAVGAYRVEIELHKEWLRVKRVTAVDDIAELADMLHPGLIRFVGEGVQINSSRVNDALKNALATWRRRWTSRRRSVWH